MRDFLFCKEGVLRSSISSYPIIKGVYFLINIDNEIVYIGQSNDCHSRVKVHRSNVGRDFLRFTIIPYPENHFMSFDDLETAYIKKFNPIYNIRGTKKYSEYVKKVYKTRKENASTGGRPKGLSKKLLDKSEGVSELYNNNTPITVIMKKMDIAPNSIYKILRHLGIKN